MTANSLPLTLILMRHAKSDWSEAGRSDHDRPLNARGRRDAPEMARWIESQFGLPDLILASTALRVVETVQLLLQTWNREIPVLSSETLYLASPHTILDHVENDSIAPDGHRAKKLMVLAHNPGLEQLVSSLAGRLTPFPTAAVAGFRGQLKTEDGSQEWQATELISLGRPKEI